MNTNYQAFSNIENDMVIMNPKDKPEDWNWDAWCLTLKISCRTNQHGLCGLCGQSIMGVPFDLHHALLTRRDVMKHAEPWRIHHIYNCLALCRDCHTNVNKQKCAQELFNLYGNKVVDWYESFELSYNKPNIFT